MRNIIKNRGRIKYPKYCYHVHGYGDDKEIIRIDRYESGYYTCDIINGEHEAQELCDSLNETIGVSKEMAEAMYAGSMFGFDLPISNPDNYTGDKLNGCDVPKIDPPKDHYLYKVEIINHLCPAADLEFDYAAYFDKCVNEYHEPTMTDYLYFDHLCNMGDVHAHIAYGYMSKIVAHVVGEI